MPYHNRMCVRVIREELTLPNGDVYTGEWDADANRMDGRGELFSLLEESLYEGQFVDGYRSLHGRVIFKNGDVYVGGWMNDEMCGMGEFRSHNGRTVYNG